MPLVNRKFQFNFTSSYMQDNNKLLTSDLTSTAILLPPNAPALYKEDGSINWQLFDGRTTFLSNPAAALIRKYSVKTNNLISNAVLSYEIIGGLRIKSNFNFNRLQADELSISPQASFNPNSTRNNRKASYVNKFVSTWEIEPQITYVKELELVALMHR